MATNNRQPAKWGGAIMALALLGACGGGGNEQPAGPKIMVKSLDEAPDGPPGWYSCSSAVSANLRAMETAGVVPEKITCKAPNTTTRPDYCFEMLIQVPLEQASQAVSAGFKTFVPPEDTQLDEVALCASNELLVKSIATLQSSAEIPYSYMVMFYPSTPQQPSPLTTREDYFRIHGEYPPIPPFAKHGTGQDTSEVARMLGLKNGQVSSILESIDSVHVFMTAEEAERLRKDPRVMSVSPDRVMTIGGPSVELIESGFVQTAQGTVVAPEHAP